MTELSEIIDALKVTSNTVGGNGMLMCAGTIDWAIEKIAKIGKIGGVDESEE